MTKFSMFETLMSLPLFKGASHEQILLFVEKTHLSFKNYNPGENIVSESEECSRLRCLLSGSMEVVYPLFAGNVLLHETVGAGRFLGVERLFGLDNTFNMTVSAVERCGIMEFSKSQNLTLLQSNQIFLMNCLNYISRHAQKCESLIGDACFESILSLLVHIVDSKTFPGSSSIKFESTTVPLIEYLSSFMPVNDEQLKKLADRGIIRVVSDYVLEIPSRSQLLNSYHRYD